jgi:hypothetical protein
MRHGFDQSLLVTPEVKAFEKKSSSATYPGFPVESGGVEQLHAAFL